MNIHSMEKTFSSARVQEVKNKIDHKQKVFMLGILNNLELDYIDEIPKEKISGPPPERGKYYKVQTSWTSTITTLFTGAKKYFPESFNQRVAKFLAGFQETHKDGNLTSMEELREAGEILKAGKYFIEELEEEGGEQGGHDMKKAA